MKVGDRLYCKKNWHLFLIKGEYYEVKKFDNILGIDIGDGQYLNVTNGVGAFAEHLYTEKEVRKLKLESIEKG